MYNKFEEVFDKTTSLKSIHEGVLLIENSEGDFSFSKGYGGREIDSPMAMASITKMFTATCILILLEHGKLSLNDTVTKFFDNATLKGLHLLHGKEYSFNLTISDLLFQTSGLPDDFESGRSNLILRTIEADEYVSFQKAINLTKNSKPKFAPGTKGKAYYSNINFDMLGEIIEKVTCLPLAEVYRQYIFNVLNLKNTYLPQSEKDFIPNIYYKNKSLYKPNMFICSKASGGGISTPRELMIFLKAFFGGKLFDKAIFKQLGIYNKLQISKGPIYYGGGHMRIKLGGLTNLFMGKGELIGHSGSTGSFAFYHPENDLFFVGDLNQMSSPALPIRLLIKLACTKYI